MKITYGIFEKFSQHSTLITSLDESTIVPVSHLRDHTRFTLEGDGPYSNVCTEPPIWLSESDHHFRVGEVTGNTSDRVWLSKCIGTTVLVGCIVRFRCIVNMVNHLSRLSLSVIERSGILGTTVSVIQYSLYWNHHDLSEPPFWLSVLVIQRFSIVEWFKGSWIHFC